MLAMGARTHGGRRLRHYHEPLDVRAENCQLCVSSHHLSSRLAFHCQGANIVVFLSCFVGRTLPACAPPPGYRALLSRALSRRAPAAARTSAAVSSIVIGLCTNGASTVLSPSPCPALPRTALPPPRPPSARPAHHTRAPAAPRPLPPCRP